MKALMKLKELLCYLSQKCKHLEMELGLQLATIITLTTSSLSYFTLSFNHQCLVLPRMLCMYWIALLTQLWWNGRPAQGRTTTLSKPSAWKKMKRVARQCHSPASSQTSYVASPTTSA